MADDDLDEAVAIFNEVRPRHGGDRVPDHGQPQRGRGPGPGGLAAVAGRRSQYGREPGGLPVDGGDRPQIAAAPAIRRARRETYIGPWLPEPVDTSADPPAGRGARGGVELRRTARARAPLADRAGGASCARHSTTRTTTRRHPAVREAAVRQLVSQARKRIRAERRTEISGTQQRKLLTAFVAAAARVISPHSNHCWPRMRSATPTAAGRPRPRASQSWAACGWRSTTGPSTRFWVGVEVEWGTANDRAVALLGVTATCSPSARSPRRPTGSTRCCG